MEYDAAPTVVLVRNNIGSGMLHDAVVWALKQMPGVEVLDGDQPDHTEADLVIERQQLGPDMTPTVLISDDGRALLSLPIDELSQNVLALVINSIRASTTHWLDTVLVISERIDAVLEQATQRAEPIYSAGGDFEDWREAFVTQRPVGAEHGSAFGSPVAADQAPVGDLLYELTATDGDRTPPNPAFAELITTYHLTRHEVDTVLLCFLHELDPRYGRRFAYLQNDPAAVRPTIDLVSTLFARGVGERLTIQRTLSTGTLITSGIVRLVSDRAGDPARAAGLALDPSVVRIITGDHSPTPEQELADPFRTARVNVDYIPTASACDAIDAQRRGEPVHLASPDPTVRRGVALDIAAALGCQLLITTYDEITQPGDDASDRASLDRGHPGRARVDRARVERFRRELIRLGAIGFVDHVPADHERWQHLLAGAGSRIVTGGPDAAHTPLEGGVARQTVHLTGPRGDERVAVWVAATATTGIKPVDGIDSLVSRFGVTVDRAVGALTTAARDFPGGVSSSDVIASLVVGGVDSAGGLLTTGRTTVTLDDLIVDADTRRRLRYACARISHRDDVIVEQGWEQRSHRMRGTYLLFAGPSGTGKTMAAEAIANELGLPIQYLELSSLLSRWVGEFERAVDKVFAAAEATGGIIAMNEADALLAPRTDVDTAQARYANAGTSHLLSRLEQFSGHIIFTSNLIGTDSIDPAFNRRLTATIRFVLPTCDQRLALWRSVWPDATAAGTPVRYTIDHQPVEHSSRLAELAAQHPLSGGSIANIARNAAFLATQRRSGQQRADQQHSGQQRSGQQRSDQRRSAALNIGTTPPDEPSTFDIDADSLDEALRLELDKIGDFRLLLGVGS